MSNHTNENTDNAQVESTDTTTPQENESSATLSAVSDVTTMSSEQSTENYIEIYHAISEWIRFADAKAAVILTVGGALAGFLIPTVQQVIADADSSAHLIPNWKEITIGFFAVYILFFMLSGFWAFLCINPIRKKGRHPSNDHCKHFHPAAISAAYSENNVSQFIDDCDHIAAVTLRREVQAAILLDSHVSRSKYSRVRISLFAFAASVLFGFLYFLTAQI